MTNCKNCGAPLCGTECQYCGTKVRWEDVVDEFDSVWYADNVPIAAAKDGELIWLRSDGDA